MKSHVVCTRGGGGSEKKTLFHYPLYVLSGDVAIDIALPNQPIPEAWITSHAYLAMVDIHDIETYMFMTNTIVI